MRADRPSGLKATESTQLLCRTGNPIGSPLFTSQNRYAVQPPGGNDLAVRAEADGFYPSFVLEDLPHTASANPIPEVCCPIQACSQDGTTIGAEGDPEDLFGCDRIGPTGCPLGTFQNRAVWS